MLRRPGKRQDDDSTDLSSNGVSSDSVVPFDHVTTNIPG